MHGELMDRLIFGWLTLLLYLKQITQLAIIIKLSKILLPVENDRYWPKADID